MSSSVRFGISIPKELLEEVEELAERLNVSRSKLVEIALRSFLAYTNLMSLDEGKASVMIIMIAKDKALKDLIPKLRDIANDLILTFKRDKVIGITFVEGDLNKIRGLIEEIKKVRGCAFYPLVIEKVRTQ